MRIKVLIRRFDLYLVILLLVLTSSGAAITYARVEEQREKSAIINQELALGFRTFAILKDSKCIGVLESDFSKDSDIYHLDFNLRISALTPEHGKFPIETEIQSSFNLFGQLLGAFIEFRALDSLFRIGFLETDPIKVKIRSQTLQGAFEKNIQIPGPLLLKERSKDRFRIEYPPLSGAAQQSVRPLIDSFFADLHQGVEVVENAANICKDGPAHSIALTPLANSLKSKAEGARSLLPLGMLEGLSLP